MENLTVELVMGYRDVEGKRYVNLGDLIMTTFKLASMQEMGYVVDFKALNQYLVNLSND